MEKETSSATVNVSSNVDGSATFIDPDTHTSSVTLISLLNTTSPENVDPVRVATIESLIASVASPDVAPPVSPVPATTDVISPDPPEVEDITIWMQT